MRDFNFSHRYPVLWKDCDITINSQVTFTAFIKYTLSDNPDLILIKITQVNSQPLLLLKKDELSPPKSDDETMQPQSESPLENQLDFKNASGKEILKYLDQFEWKPEYLKKFEKFKPARERAVREIVGKLETKYCEKCPGRHMVQIFRDMVDDETKMKFQSLFTEVDYNLFKKKRKMVMHVYGNSLLLINPLYVQCPLCCNIVSLGHINEIFIKGDKLVNHLTTIHCRESNVTVKGMYYC